MSITTSKAYNDTHIRQKTEPLSISTDEVADAIDNAIDASTLKNADDADGVSSKDITLSGAIILTGRFTPPKYTTTERDAISSPTEGLLIENTTDHTIEYYDGTSWQPLGSVGGSTPNLEAVATVGNTTTKGLYSDITGGSSVALVKDVTDMAGVNNPLIGFGSVNSSGNYGGQLWLKSLNNSFLTNTILEAQQTISATRKVLLPSPSLNNKTLSIGATDGSTPVYAGADGMIDISSLLTGGGSIDESFHDLADAGTIDVDYATGRNFNIGPLAGDRLITFSNPVEGRELKLVFTQDGTGGRTVTFPTGTKIPLGFGTDETANLSTAGGAEDWWTVIYNGTNYRAFPSGLNMV